MAHSSPLSGTLGRKASPRKHRELWAALLAVLLIGALYLGAVTALQDIPAASSLLGHGLGITGFVLMLMTETLYSLRKRRRISGWGRLSDWLQFHIFTGLVGPFMVLLHTSWKFSGLAGILTLLTVVIVVSGFIGRYLYTSIPRTAGGAELEERELEEQIAALEAEIATLAEHPAPGAARDGARGLKSLHARRKTLERQRRSLAAARRLLALWHAVHIPIGMALFTTAALHILAALYYATLLR